MSTTDRTRAFARTIEVPALTIGAADAVLGIETSDGETASMALLVNGSTVARGEGFRVAEAGPWTWLDMPEREVVETFAAFLSHAVESSDEDAREAWPILTDEAAEWTDALSLYSADEYGTCQTCGDPIDYCQGHGAPMPEVEQSARMVCVIDGITYKWGTGEYVELHAEAEAAPFDLFNVWDYSAGAPSIPRTLDAFEARCVEYASEVGS
ncbi:MAG: hypothetical protein WKF96_15320 [Solirubrobacteraceae bacterium]